MPDELTRYINKMKEKRRKHEEMKEVLIEYFDSNINRDDEVARALEIDESEIKKLRRDFEG